ncbi:hypothetical protein H257_02055 [Aphanomyces astaci]|uniref:Uncharacterized protein n=1 Tax=Aphanomyces astaci TaxID=112090 RepID=W4H4X1_APHAT|nr:hypothetical protein H257_02055 [Aphanomyces astaci]ETV87045.1 hypothetical protein H257_02055 [Aphanomyces astaci]|eukprot:XP_009823844.1 hypothetical protein H257_02055 [Aphanomyces astaci]
MAFFFVGTSDHKPSSPVHVQISTSDKQTFDMAFMGDRWLAMEPLKTTTPFCCRGNRRIQRDPSISSSVFGTLVALSAIEARLSVPLFTINKSGFLTSGMIESVQKVVSIDVSVAVFYHEFGGMQVAGLVAAIAPISTRSESSSFTTSPSVSY